MPPVFPADPLTTTTSADGLAKIEVRTAPTQPPARGVVDVELVVRGGDGAPIGNLALEVVPWMPAHGHGTSVTPTVVDLGNGHYWVRDLDLYMPGEWDLRLSLGEAPTRQADAAIDVQ